MTKHKARKGQVLGSAPACATSKAQLEVKESVPGDHVTTTTTQLQLALAQQVRRTQPPVCEDMPSPVDATPQACDANHRCWMSGASALQNLLSNTVVPHSRRHI
jgi:hypothetical protein